MVNGLLCQGCGKLNTGSHPQAGSIRCKELDCYDYRKRSLFEKLKFWSK